MNGTKSGNGGKLPKTLPTMAPKSRGWAMKRGTLLAMLLLALVLVGCGKPSVQGSWVNPAGEVTTIDEEWFTASDGSQSRYTVTGDTSLQLTRDGETAEVRYTLDGEQLTLNLDGKETVFQREGSAGAKATQSAASKEADAKACTSNRYGTTRLMTVGGGAPVSRGMDYATVLTVMKREFADRASVLPTDYGQACPAGGKYEVDWSTPSRVSIKCSVHGAAERSFVTAD